MEAGRSGAIGAVWLGILTSISPCPLATNIAAISYVGNDESPRRVAACGLAYTAGRMVAYLALGILLVAGLLSSSLLSNLLQRLLNSILGPILILTGMVLLDLPSWKPQGGVIGESVRRQADRGGITGAGLLGAVFAGLEVGPSPPEVPNVFVEITPCDLTKSEVDKASGYLRVDRPHRGSSQPPALYGFVPRTYCGDRVRRLSPGSKAGDGDPLDIVV